MRSQPSNIGVIGLVALLGACAGGSDDSAATSDATGLTSITAAATTTDASAASESSAATTSTTIDPTTTDDPTTTSTPDSSTSGAPETSSADASTGDATTGAPPSLCAPPGNLIEHGSLDEGMNGQAPAGWEVRQPGQPETCGGVHVFASGPAPGCDGGGITVDAQGQWDCYAVQTVSPYNSITGGASYRIQAGVRSEGNAVNPAAWFVLGVQWLDENDGFFGDEKNPKPLDSADNDYDWKLLEWDLVAPPNARRILVWMSAHYPGKVEFDHVAVLPL